MPVLNYLGFYLLSTILFLGALFIIQSALGASESENLSGSVVVGNVPPTASGIKLNNNTDITLDPNATTSIAVSFTVTDVNGCTNVFEDGSVTTTIYRATFGSACATDNLNCYQISTSTHNCESATSSSADATSTFEIWYFAEATDASSSYSSDYWEAYVEIADGGGATSSASSTGQELNTLVSINLNTSSINYGTLLPSSTTGFANQIGGVKNTGNASSSIGVSGTALIGSSAEIVTSSQHYASSSFYFGGSEPQLSGTNSTISGITLTPRISLVNDIGSWTDTAPLASSPRFAGYSNTSYHVYVTGGQTTTTVSYASFNSDGTLGSWADTTALGNSRFLHASLIYNDYLYAIGGSGLFSDAEYAPINSGGDVGSWSGTTGAPTGGDFSNFPAVANNGYIYTLGGIDNVDRISTVFYSTFNTDGTINNSWSTTTALPSAISDSAAVVYNGFIYVLGGKDGSNTSTVVFAPINTDGTLGSWTNTTALPGTMSGHAATAVSGYIYVLGSSTTSVFYTAINSEGGIDSWSSATVMPTDLSSIDSVNNNGYIYGLPNDSTTSTVIYAPILNGRNQRDIFWGIELVGFLPQGTYTGTSTFTGDFQE